jgi:hypothetical protein
MSQKSSVPQAVSFVSQVLKRDNRVVVEDCNGEVASLIEAVPVVLPVVIGRSGIVENGMEC